MRPVIVIDTNEAEEEVGTMFLCVSDAAVALNRHPSTVHRALTGSRGRDQVAERTVVDLEMGMQDSELVLALDDMYEMA